MHIGRLAALAVGLVMAGTGFLAAVLPREVDLRGADGRSIASVSCDPPAVDAFREVGEQPGGWFAYAPNTTVVFGDMGFCVPEARRRLSLGVVGMIVGGALALAARLPEADATDR